MKRIFAISVSGILGGIFGYFVGVSVGCDWLYPTSNLCGVYGLLITGPIGFIAGIVVSWIASRPKER